MRKIAISIFLSCLLFSKSYAYNWQEISPLNYIDLDSISNVDIAGHKNTTSVWVKSYNDNSSKFKKNESYILAKFLIDCTNKEHAIKGGGTYDINNTPLQQANFDTNSLEWNSFIPESNVDIIAQYVCKPDKLQTTNNSITKQDSAIDIYNKHVNSMVYVKTNDSVGSGVIVKEDGTFITCFHVIENADYITIKTHDGRAFKVNGFKYINPTEDIAILTIDASYNKFTPIDINYKSLQIGEKVYTISNPKGLEFTFSDGMINQYKNEYIQFSAPISPGSSGGALLNENGQLIGIITSYLGKAQNINFALPNDYYVSRINNLTIRNTYNQNWTKFLLSQTGNNQFKINTDYRNIEKENFETYYDRVKYYVNLPGYPPHLYALAGYLAFYAYFETLKQTILNDAIKWYELSLINNENIEISLFALSLLYTINYDQTKLEKCLVAIYEQYPESAQVITFISKNKDKSLDAYITHFEKLTDRIRR